MGAYALAWGVGSRVNEVTDCEFSDLGAGGIKVGEIPPGMFADEEAPPSANASRMAGNTIIRNNVVHGGGLLHPGAVGIWIGHSPNNVVDNNEVSDFFYTGISVGWTWGYGPSLAVNNTIANNTVFHIGKGVLSDLGGIYTLGVSPGTSVRNNLVHDVKSFANAGRGIYLDEGSSEIVVENNVVYDTSFESFALSFGRNNLVRNNIFALSQTYALVLGRATTELALRFEHNLVYWVHGDVARAKWPEGSYYFDHNLYWNTGHQPLVWGTRTWRQWLEAGQDRHSRVADPLFLNPEHGDFRLRQGSPAASVGFHPFEAGRRY